MNKDIQIEIVNDVDRIEQVLLMFENYFPRPLSERVDSLRDYAQKLADKAVVVVSSLEKKTIGYAAFYCNDQLTKHAFFTAIAIDNNYKGQGIASALLDFCFDYMKQKGMVKIVGEVDNINSASLKISKRHGFVVTGKATDCSVFIEKIL